MRRVVVMQLALALASGEMPCDRHLATVAAALFAFDQPCAA
jgi:hypothetical protein